MSEVPTAEGGHKVNTRRVRHRGGERLNVRGGLDDAEVVPEPLHPRTRDGHRALEGISRGSIRTQLPRRRVVAQSPLYDVFAQSINIKKKKRKKNERVTLGSAKGMGSWVITQEVFNLASSTEMEYQQPTRVGGYLHQTLLACYGRILSPRP